MLWKLKNRTNVIICVSTVRVFFYDQISQGITRVRRDPAMLAEILVYFSIKVFTLGLVGFFF